MDEDHGPVLACALPERDLLAVDGDLLLVHLVVPFPLRALTIQATWRPGRVWAPLQTTWPGLGTLQTT